MATDGKTNGAIYSQWDFSKVWADVKMPEFNFDVMIAAQQKNIETMNLANRAAVEGWQAFAKKQAELWRHAVEDTGALAKGVAFAKEPTDNLAKQADFAKSAMKTGLANAREAQELAAKTTNITVDIVSKRLVEGMDEVVSYVETGQRKAAAAK